MLTKGIRWTTCSALVLATWVIAGAPLPMRAQQQQTGGTSQGTTSTNVAQVSGTAADTNSGVKSAGTLRVVIATDQPALTNKLLVTPDSVALPANQSVNVSQINGVTTTMGNGISGTGVQRITLASDSTGQVTLAAGAATIGALTANQSVNVAQVNGVATSTGVGATGTGVQRIVLATNDPCGSSGIAKSSVVVNVTTSAQIIAASGSTIIYVCGYSIAITGTTPTYQFQYGTGSNCATGTTNVTGAYAPLTGTYAAYGGSDATVFATTASQALCIATTGTTPSVQGVVTYIQQ